MTDAIDVLFLLIGTNPLPDYVVAKHFQPRNIVLMKTIRTSGEAERLSKELETAISGVKIAQVEIDAFDPQKIYSVSMDVFKQLDSSKTGLLNYTCGTKAMAVHVTRAWLERITISNSGKPPGWSRMSYLNSKGEITWYGETVVQTPATVSVSDDLLAGDLDAILRLHEGNDQITTYDPKSIIRIIESRLHDGSNIETVTNFVNAIGANGVRLFGIYFIKNASGNPIMLFFTHKSRLFSALLEARSCVGKREIKLAAFIADRITQNFGGVLGRCGILALDQTIQKDAFNMRNADFINDTAFNPPEVFTINDVKNCAYKIAKWLDGK